jgi:ribonuclease III
MDISSLMQKLRYRFKDFSLVEEALRHSSFVNEQSDMNMQDNERLEFLGDAVLNLIVGHLLMEHLPEINEGDLSRMRASLVNESQLADIARSIELGNDIKLGKGERLSNGQEKNSILANAYEAVLAAIYLDGGFESAFIVVKTHFSRLFDKLKIMETNQDFKSQLQEFVQSSQQQIPIYTVVDESGPDHDKIFSVQLEVIGIQTEGRGKSKKLAEQDAARQALEKLRPLRT